CFTICCLNWIIPIKKVLKFLDLWNDESSRDPPVIPDIPNEIVYVPIDDGWNQTGSDFIG
ncbi:hypothetical protein KKA14_17810, partial [bacterium]|nr:hypothetical protein [bacterium]